MPRKYSEIIDHINALRDAGYCSNNIEMKLVVEESMKALFLKEEFDGEMLPKAIEI